MKDHSGMKCPTKEDCEAHRSMARVQKRIMRLVRLPASAHDTLIHDYLAREESRDDHG
jgi:hypothetical protein